MSVLFYCSKKNQILLKVSTWVVCFLYKMEDQVDTFEVKKDTNNEQVTHLGSCFLYKMEDQVRHF